LSNQIRSELKRSKYRILGLVGQGQFGRVYCAVHRQTGQLVALKSLEHQRFPTHKFLRELRFLLSLQHTNIVTCQALEHTATGRYLVMDYCEGGTLRSLMSDRQHLTLRQRLKLIIDILQGLDHAHNRGIIHCDIKPENILLNLQPTGWTARISDFGIARLNQEVGAQGLGNTGSPAYMAPERFYGQYPLSSDLYAVGILLFELLVGHRPFSGTPGELMFAHLNCPVKIPDTIPKAWQSIILMALQKLSARRFQSAGAMLNAIREVAMQEGVGTWLKPQLPVALPKLQGFNSTVPFVFHQQEALKQPVTALATQFSEGEGSPKITSLFEVWHQISPQNAIQNLLVRPQGCFVLTKRSLHLLPSTATHEPLKAQLLLELTHDCVAAVEPMGRWFVTLENTRAAKLCFWKLQGDPLQKLQGDSLQTSQSDSLRVSRRVRATLLTCSTLALQALPLLPPLLFALDACHAAVITTTFERQPPASRSQKGDTWVQVLTRRGTRAGSLRLPVRIGQAVQTSAPYQFLATDVDNPESILLIDLKPYRILRLDVGIVPKFLSATPWGFILADAQGVIMFFARDGEVLGRVQGSAEMTAIASCSARNINVAIWNGHQGQLYTSDLRDLQIDLLF
jgi:serine/threonine protein kinase